MSHSILGTYFIDRNPKHFDRILDYLRYGEFKVEGLSEFDMDKLRADFDYYQIDLPDSLQVRLYFVH
jgi:hypothetical protein